MTDTDTVAFEGWPKIQRTDKNTVVFTEKIDGTNAAIGVRELTDPHGILSFETLVATASGRFLAVRAQSRKRFITPNADNAGFARWAFDNAELLAPFLGEGLHFGEWWGSGIQRGYGLEKKVFSLFNTTRWAEPLLEAHAIQDLGVDVVPVLGVWDGNDFGNGLRAALDVILIGSVAAARQGVSYERVEGVMSYWAAFGKYLKHVIDK